MQTPNTSLPKVASFSLASDSLKQVALLIQFPLDLVTFSQIDL
jgi:hypothetical protein